MGNTWYLDLINGNDSYTGTSYAQRRQTIDGIIPLVQPSDLILIMASAAARDTTLTSQFTQGSNVVSLSASVSVNLQVGTALAANGATYHSDSVTSKTGTSIQFTVPGSTTGKIGFTSDGNSRTISAYQQISFWFQTDTAIPAGTMYLGLSGGTTGDSVLYQVPIPAINSLNQWTPITFDFGTAISGSIGSIGLYINSAIGSNATIWIDNVVACLSPASAMCITHQTLIGNQNSTGVGDGSSSWNTIAVLNGTSLTLDQAPGSNFSDIQPFYGASVLDELWTREPILTSVAATETESVNLFSMNGSIDQQIEWRFGMDPNAMTNQVDDTWFSGQNGRGAGVKVQGDFNKITGLALSRYHYGLWISGSHGGVYDLPGLISCDFTNFMVDGTSTENTARVRFNHRSQGSGYIDHPNGGQNDLQFDFVTSNNSYGVEISSNDLLHDCSIYNNANSAIHTAGAVRIYRVSTDGNGASIAAGTAGTGITGTYYSEWEFQGLIFTRIDPNIDFYWQPTYPVVGFPTTYWNARWVGWVTPKYTEPYTFFFVVDDGGRLWIDDVLIIDNWITAENHLVTSIVINLTGNVPHKIVCEYRQGPLAYANITLQWRSPSQPQQTIPTDRFSVNLPTTSALAVSSDASAGYEINLHDCVFQEDVKFTGLSDYYNIRVRSHNDEGTKGKHLMMTDGGIVVNDQGSDRHTLVGYAWKLTPSAPRSVLYPLDYKLASIAVTSNKPVRITLYMKRSDVLVTGQLFIPGGQIDGAPNDMAASSTLIGEYEQLALTFTPTELGVVDVYARVFGNDGSTGSSNVWVDDMSVSQM